VGSLGADQLRNRWVHAIGSVDGHRAADPGERRRRRERMRITISKDGTADLVLSEEAVAWGEGGTLTHVDRSEVESVLHRYGDDESAWMTLGYSGGEGADGGAERHWRPPRLTPGWAALIALYELPEMGYRVVIADGQVKPPNRAHRGG
jgi:hypothetical protein